MNENTTDILQPEEDTGNKPMDGDESKSLLRFITCGSVDDGKSTLLGRLLFEAKSVFEDQMLSTETESRKYGTQGEEIDLALLVDGLQAEREQGITIDVAYRFFETDKRKFIAADTPGHEQYTRNMVTGASTADLAIILIDARKGILTQTKRHSYIAYLLGIKNIILAVNKMDLVDYDKSGFDKIIQDYQAFTKDFDFEDIQAIPLSALKGENITQKSGHMPWYDGPTLLEALETSTAISHAHEKPFRLPIQWVNRPNADFRGLSGTLASGTLEEGDPVMSVRSGQVSSIKSILGPSGEIDKARTGEAVTVILADEIDLSRGDVLCKEGDRAILADQFAAHVIWMADEEMLPERSYMIRFVTTEAEAQITDLSYRIDINSHKHLAAKTLALNEVGYCKLALNQPALIDPYKEYPATGSFIIIDKMTNATVGAGLVDHYLRRATNVVWHEMKISKETRAKVNSQEPSILWFTGLSGSGKSTISDKLEQKLHQMGKRTYLLDGDNIRHGLNKDLGFTDQDRVENIRRVAEVAKLMVDAGLIVLVSFISPFRSERDMARELVEPEEFYEIFIDTPLEVCEERDPKGLYKKARAGRLKNFTGIDSDYEAPENPELVLKNYDTTPDDMADEIISLLKARGRL